MIRRNFSPILAICLALPILLLAGQTLFARNWTDKRGRQIEAKFIRVDGDNVVLQKGSKPITVPFAQLSGEDQDYVRSLTEKKSKPKDSDDDNPFQDTDDSTVAKPDKTKAKSTDDDNPFEEVGESPAKKSNKQAKSKSKSDDADNPFQDADNAPAVKPKKPKAKSTDDSVAKNSDDAPKTPPAEKPKPLPKTAKDRAADEIKNGEFAERDWSDKKGNKLKATFVRLEDTKVVLSQNGRERTFPIDQFSYDDKLYIRRAAVEAQKHPKQIAKNDDPPARQTGPATTGFPPSSFQGGNSAADAMRQAEEERRRRDAEAAQQRAIAESQRQQREQKEREERDRRTQEQLAQQAQPPQVVQPDSFHASPRAFPQVPQTIPSAAQQVEVKVCGSCNKEIPQNLSAGDRCPHCGVFWSYDETNGRKAVDPSPSSGGSTGVSIVGIIVAICVVCLKLWLRSR